MIATILIGSVYGILAIWCFPYFAFILITSLAALTADKSARVTCAPNSVEGPSPFRFLVVIPAHDEEAHLVRTVKSCKELCYPPSSFEVLVIADNCTDRTAAIAGEAGARVVERFDPSRKSKGHAIEYLIDQLNASGEAETLDALVIVDADSTVDPKLLDRFAEGLGRGYDWMQCYDSVCKEGQAWRQRLLAYAFSLINGVTPLGLETLGLSTGLRGNGMCLSMPGLRRVPWRAHGLTEDIEYSWTLRAAGERIHFIRDVAVHATMLAEGGTPTANQRRRWEFGRNSVRRSMLVPLLRSPNLDWFKKSAAVIELTCHAAMHLLFIYGVLTLGFFWLMPGMIREHHYALLLVAVLFQTIATLAIVIHALSPFLLSWIPWHFSLTLFYLPYYAVWKMRILLLGAPKEWVRTARDSGHGVPPRS